MTPLVLLGGGAVLAYLLSKGGTAATAKQTQVGGSWTDTTKPMGERMALALATRDPSQINTLASQLRAQGHTTQADSLVRELSVLQTLPKTPNLQTVARPGATTPAVSTAPMPVPVGVSPGPSNTTGSTVVSAAQVPDTLPSLGPGEVLQQGNAAFDMRVAQWQKFLVSIGMLGSNGIDGIFGPETEAGTITFQGAAGLTPDGIVGESTLAAAAQS